MLPILTFQQITHQLQTDPLRWPCFQGLKSCHLLYISSKISFYSPVFFLIILVLWKTTKQKTYNAKLFSSPKNHLDNSRNLFRDGSLLKKKIEYIFLHKHPCISIWNFTMLFFSSYITLCIVQFWYFHLLSIFHSVYPSQVMDLCWTSINVTAKTAFIIQAELQSMALKVSTMIKCYGSINGLNKNMRFQKIFITFHVVDVFFFFFL